MNHYQYNDSIGLDDRIKSQPPLKELPFVRVEFGYRNKMIK